MNFEICQRCGGVFGRVSCSCDLGEVKCTPETEESPSLQLLIIDLGDSCLVRSEKGNLDETFLPTLIGTYLRENLYWISKPFMELREAIEQKPVPRIEAESGGAWYLYFNNQDIEPQHTYIGPNARVALESLFHKPLPIWKGGEWKQVLDDELPAASRLELPAIWRYTK